jgi:hypothetical protein
MPPAMATAARGFTAPNTASLMQYYTLTTPTKTITTTVTAAHKLANPLLAPPPAFYPSLYDAATRVFDFVVKKGFAEAGLGDLKAMVKHLLVAALVGGGAICAGKMMARLIQAAPHWQVPQAWRQKITYGLSMFITMVKTDKQVPLAITQVHRDIAIAKVEAANLRTQLSAGQLDLEATPMGSTSRARVEQVNN